MVGAKGVYGYEKFKTYLIQTGQSLLSKYLEKVENGEEVKHDDQLIKDLHAQTYARKQTENVPETEGKKDFHEEMNPHKKDSEQEGNEVNTIELHKRVLDLSQRTIKECLIPQPILDDFTEQEFLPLSEIRDIRESLTTTKMNQDIIYNVRAKGKDGYEVFKACLKKSNQNLLHTYLVMVEKGDDTKEVLAKLKEETKAREKAVRKESRKRELKEKDTVNSIEEHLILANKKGTDFKGKQDIEERLNVKGSTEINRQRCCYTIKCIFDQKTEDIYSEQIIEAASDIASMINVEVRKTWVDENNCVVITMTCSSSKEMIALLKTLNGDQFQTKINDLKDSFTKEYDDSFVVKAKLSPEKILEVHNNLREQGIIEKRDGHSFCDQHAGVRQMNEYFCPSHDVFCCDQCAMNVHRKCAGLRQITTDPILEADDGLNGNANTFPKYKKDYRVRVDEQELCTTKRVCILSNSEIFIIDNVNKRLKKLNMFYKVESLCHFHEPPLDVCVVDDSTVLVSFGYKVSFVNIRGALTTEKELTLKTQCYCVAWHDDGIYYTDNLSLLKCNKNGENHQHVCSFREKNITCNRLVVSKDGVKIYIAAGAKGLITIDTIQEKQSFVSCRQLMMCTDIFLINSKCLLACDFSSHAVYLMDVESGKILKTVTDSSNGLQLPRSIYFDDTDSTLVVGRLGRDFISVFELELEI